MKELKRSDLVHPDLSYKIIGVLFDVYNNLGPGHHEKYYQRAIVKELEAKKIHFIREARYPLEYKGDVIGNNYLDFLIEDMIVLEIKKGNQFSKRHIDQVIKYLNLTNKKLAILANFSSQGIIYKRIVNIK